ncbi:hypothetical protein EA658_12535 [Pseudoxanthomonas winnipegensis]|jgi:hypothetical protein|uniref:Uncharacterized protein n=1 Tax=Pseudoxanthomonas winnipegensis TaxID=2480810 RepID=A0ABY1WE29_9GAMM|nr:hypothetical protein [Pseudoxanthomonas winnipegensis]TAA11979.1 hypothetical protein EA659_01115 [Pseudoxanthomonas winnipegensis]TAA19657.1 hypothetical protein EA658_12535 [Pseudoxanthomonas winnipegensis]TAH70926.1 hypothetical protein EA657_14820 [Pseudoxanthomonas winnipegensis]
MEFLRDPLWQFIGAVLALAGIVAAILIFIMQREVRELSAGFLVKKHLISVSDSVSDRISIRLDGRDIENLKIYSYGFKNSGNVEIRPNDFEKSVSLTIGDGAEIVEFSVAKVNPPALDPIVSGDKSKILIDPLLLNPGDYFVVDVLATGASSTLNVDCRVAGISSLQKINSGVRYTSDRTTNLIYNLIVSCVVGAAMYFVAKFSGDPPRIALISVGGVAGMLVLMNVVHYAVGRIRNTSNRYIDVI